MLFGKNFREFSDRRGKEKNGPDYFTGHEKKGGKGEAADGMMPLEFVVISLQCQKDKKKKKNPSYADRNV